MRPVLIALALLAPCLHAADLKPLTYTEIGKMVRAHRGKPILVYFWSST